MEQTKRLQSIKDFNDWFADYLVLNEMHGVLEPSPLHYPATVHWEQKDTGIEFTYCKLYYYFTYGR